MATATISTAEVISTSILVQQERTLYSISVPAEQVPEAKLDQTHRRVFAYWKQKRGTRHAPRRADIDPCDLGFVLPNLILWEIDDVPDYRVRLAGTDVCHNMLGELRGVLLGELRCPLLAEARREFDAVRDEGLISLVERTLHWLDRPLVFYRHLLMPLVDDTGRVNMLLSVMTFESTDRWRLFLQGQGAQPGTA
ncbi:MAG TPA: PAS domain-containing protein [Aliidongia sp.]|nr:PAS domain-containing protein [Aliidongia sp.]